MATTPTPSLFTLAILSCLVQFRANAYIGGVPLRTPGTCPAGSVVGEVTFEQNCCGANQTFVKVEGSVCCPDSVDCYAEVVAAPQVCQSFHRLFISTSQFSSTNPILCRGNNTDHKSSAQTRPGSFAEQTAAGSAAKQTGSATRKSPPARSVQA
jgi:hypothetical protein